MGRYRETNEALRDLLLSSVLVLIKLGLGVGSASLHDSTRHFAANMWKSGRRGCRNRHSLCPAIEYTPIVHDTQPSIVCKPCGPRHATVQAPYSTKGSAVVHKMGSDCMMW